MKLLLPLKYYDDAGRVKPLLWFNLCLLFLARSYFVFVISAANMNDSGKLLGLFYPDKYDFYLGLLLGLPAVFCWAVASYRKQLWQKKYLTLFYWLKPLLLLTLIADFAMHLQMAFQQHWAFSWVLALSLLLDALLFAYVARSKKLKLMISDWQKLQQF